LGLVTKTDPLLKDTKIAWKALINEFPMKKMKNLTDHLQK
jgi:hypothetical protein